MNKLTNDDETVMFTHKEKLVSFDRYNQLEKAARNEEYLAMIDRGIAQLSAGKGQEHELLEVDE